MLDVFITSRVRRKIVVVYAKYPDFRTHVRGLAKLIYGELPHASLEDAAEDFRHAIKLNPRRAGLDTVSESAICLAGEIVDQRGGMFGHGPRGLPRRYWEFQGTPRRQASKGASFRAAPPGRIKPSLRCAFHFFL